MKTRMILATLLLLAFGSAKAQENEAPKVNAIQVDGSCDVRLYQSTDKFSVVRNESYTSQYDVFDGILVLSGSSSYEVYMQQLDRIILHSSGDVFGKGTIKGNNLRIVVTGSGDLWMTVDYDTIFVKMSGSGDVTLDGRCRVIYAEMSGSGDLKAQQLDSEKSYVNSTGSGRARMGNSSNVASYSRFRERKYGNKGLLFNASWNGFDAGLNMLINTPGDAAYVHSDAQSLEIRPMRSWYFGFNFADVGIAFGKRHRVGAFTGVGLGWHNYSWNNDIQVAFDPRNVIYKVEPIDEGILVKNTKYGALFLQVPLMIEVRPTRYMYIDAGVTGGIRLAQWNRVKFADGTQIKRYFGSTNGLNLFKLDASFRIGNDCLGFFANYSLLPIFETKTVKVHPISFGFSLCF